MKLKFLKLRRKQKIKLIWIIIALATAFSLLIPSLIPIIDLLR